jgi:hypothetical protein
MNRMHAAKGLGIIEAPEDEFPPSAYFDFVACCELAFLSMGTLTVGAARKPRGRTADEPSCCRCAQTKSWF